MNRLTLLQVTITMRRKTNGRKNTPGPSINILTFHSKENGNQREVAIHILYQFLKNRI